MSYSRKIRRAAMVACGVFALSAGQAMAADQDVNGEVEGYLALTSNGSATMTPFYPGASSAGNSSLTATSTYSNWYVSAVANDLTPGQMDSQPVGPSCNDSVSYISSSLYVNSNPISATAVTVFPGSGEPAAGDILATNYTLSIPSSNQLLQGCDYKEVVTYTIATP